MSAFYSWLNKVILVWKIHFFCHLDTQIGFKTKKILTAYNEDSLKNFLRLMF